LQVACGSPLPGGTSVHLPIDPGRAQPRQPPSHALLQQTPSTHWPDLHSLPALQSWPSCFGPQVWLTQLMPASQSASALQTLVQAPAWHWNGEQLIRPGGRQDPSPSQVPAVLSRFPVQDGAVQTVPNAYSAQPPSPSQSPVWAQVAAPWSLHRRCG